MTRLKPAKEGEAFVPDMEMSPRRWPMVSITIPTLNEARYIRSTLEAICQQDYPLERMEIIIADGLSTDNTRAIVEDYCRKLQGERNGTAPIIKLIDNPGRIVSTGLNAAIRAARGEIVVRVDGHTIIAPDYVRQCVAALERSGAAGVGGRMDAIGVGYVSRAIALATSSRFGIGNSLYRTRRFITERAVETTHMGAYRRQKLLDIGLFNEQFVRHQDYELDYRIRQQGGSIFLSPAIRSHYFVRGSLRKLKRQYFQYGFWKGRMLRKEPSSARLRHLAPPLFVLAMISTSLLGLLNIPYAAVLLTFISMLYLFFIVSGALTICAGEQARWKFLPLLPIVLTVLHLSWGSGLWLGVLTPERLSPRWWPR